ncbi:phosphoserine transaminase [Campylobacter insulaenigrae]|uniref:Phosphoserine aminotransferase n=1 Tax=Campylobacter insulaenigrae NCTC 12927 TaxID=1031564 RepID=A0A0A8H5Q4_9BACT|nr:phosphoserine transaminase [Campylobacter insulaenigrae]AJC88254.1 phosphohydroxythreonine aminotransferase / 3-phosphoserine aminotransferase [Campylobacter insulaenigrae NCTC 12927]MCR6591764.1 phosphoserine transaminase [Campylobacter insulaenigrae]MCR6593256.1 phosphoserine transaminase [Campylobacter insulaenigrae]VEH95469.1 phosphoserine aminotransferase [Campylobacter insulaenigrae]VEJ55163.1 phosphoserine aminotransferase [Campylobacter insulaenigrae]
MRVINFSAGPSNLPDEVLKEAQENLFDYHQKGFSIMEVSHRGKIFEEVHFEAMKLAKQLYEVNDDYEILFFQGGASLQFAMIPMNLSLGGISEFANTGVWTKKAIKEAQILKVNTQIVASSEDSGFDHIPNFKFSDDVDYAYICSNNTIYGTQYNNYPITKSPLIVDASSDFFSKKLNFSNIAMLFGGVQKNAGISGLACAFIRKDMIERSKSKNIPSMLKYSVYVENDSMFNTPATFAIYMFNLEMKWLLNQGGLDKINEQNIQKAKFLYEIIDQSEGFYQGYAKKEDRSLMNVSFNIADKNLESKFLQEAEENGMIGLKGHKILGGIRASIYNSIDLKKVQILGEFMKDFAKKNA